MTSAVEQKSAIPEVKSKLNPLIMAVDDSEIMLKKYHAQFKTAAELQDYDLITCSHPMEALKTMLLKKVSLVLLDWNLVDGMSGLDLLKKIKQSDSLKNIPVIMVTVVGDKSKIIEAVQAGAKDYVVKPVRNQHLAEKIVRHLNIQ